MEFDVDSFVHTNRLERGEIRSFPFYWRKEEDDEGYLRWAKLKHRARNL
jgi:hypothetical protein